MKLLIELFIIILLASAQSSGLDDSKAHGFAHTESSKQINNLYETPLEEHNHSEPTLALNAQTNQSNESKIIVHSGESIQAAINAATPGDIIEIALTSILLLIFPRWRRNPFAAVLPKKGDFPHLHSNAFKKQGCKADQRAFLDLLKPETLDSHVFPPYFGNNSLIVV